MTRSSDLYVTHATFRDARRLGPSLRDQDKAEAEALHSLSPTDLLLLSMSISDQTFTVQAGSVPVGMFGHLDAGNGVGVVWMVGSPGLTADVPEFLRATREFFPRLMHPYQVVTNIVSEENTLHRRWLKWLGFVEGPAHPYGRFGLPFRRFTYVRPSFSRCVIADRRHRIGGGVGSRPGVHGISEPEDS